MMLLFKGSMIAWGQDIQLTFSNFFTDVFFHLYITVIWAFPNSLQSPPDSWLCQMLGNSLKDRLVAPWRLEFLVTLRYIIQNQNKAFSTCSATAFYLFSCLTMPPLNEISNLILGEKNVWSTFTLMWTKAISESASLSKASFF